jgi:hypothetical protein
MPGASPPEVMIPIFVIFFDMSTTSVVTGKDRRDSVVLAVANLTIKYEKSGHFDQPTGLFIHI